MEPKKNCFAGSVANNSCYQPEKLEISLVDKATEAIELSKIHFFFILWQLKIYGALIFVIYSLSSMLISAEHMVLVMQKISIWLDQKPLLYS